MRVVLLGAGGMLARELLSQTPAGTDVIAFTRADLDVRDAARVGEAIRRSRPQWVVNASAYTKVDQAEDDATDAFAVNSVAVGQIARACRESACGVLHYSTDYVFDGTKDGYYTEDDRPNPLSAYGASKLEGEERLRSSGATYLIIRTQWLFGGAGKSFISSILERAMHGTETRAADDQFGCCTYSVDLAQVSWALVSDMFTGTFHVANRGIVSRYVLAQRVFGALGVPELLSPCSATEFPSRAPRPKSSPLSVEKVERALGRRLDEWPIALERYLAAAGVGQRLTRN